MDLLWNIAATGAFFFCALVLILRWCAQSGLALNGALAEPPPKRAGKKPQANVLWRVFFSAVAFRLITAGVGLLLYNLLQGVSLGVADLPELWTRWDGQHYVKLAELGYSGYVENGQNLFLVFFPLYVWVTRLVRLMIPNTALAGMLVSYFCFGWGNVYLYRLASEEYGEKNAHLALALLWFGPFSFFFGGIMTESLFLLTTSAGLYYIRRHRWGMAAMWGVLASLTRMQGVILIGAAIAELCNQEKPFGKIKEERRYALLSILKKLPILCAPILGGIGYFGLNYYVTGNPFAFSIMQRHWSQGFMWFPDVLSYLARNALGWHNEMTRWEMWIPEFILFWLVAVLLLKSWKKYRSMLVLYGFVYFILNYCLSWLLSAGRYLACGVPFYLFGAEELKGRKGLAITVLTIMGALQCFFLYRYLCWGQVM